MPIALTDEHQDLAAIVAAYAERRSLRAEARSLLEDPQETLPSWWGELADLGWLGLHLPEEYGGGGHGLEDLVVVVEQLGAHLAPGPFVPTVVAGALLAAVDDPAVKAHLSALADGSAVAGIGLQSELSLEEGGVTGTAVVLGGGLADLMLVASGADAVLLATAEGVTVEVPDNLDPSRRTARVRFDAASGTVLTGAGTLLVDLARVVLAAEAAGIATRVTEVTAAYARERVQFGRPIGTFQAVKHHCANMAVAAELATAAAWDAARAAAGGGTQLTYAAAAAAAVAGPAAAMCADLSIQVHGGIGMTWEHDAHLYLRRAAVVSALLDPADGAADLTRLARDGVVRERGIDLPEEAERYRGEVRELIARIRDLDDEQRRVALVDSGYAVPHWPAPYGRAAGAVEQLVVEQELAAAEITRPTYGITAWVVLTILQHGTDEQRERWVRPALEKRAVWCQLFSEPGAGSDAAGIRTRAVRTEGGWILNGQKVWTSDAHRAPHGLATVRTDPDVPKHQGITVMAIDMGAPGVEVRPLRQPNGQAEFNEVFLTDVFVPDADVVGEVGAGWTVARATMGNESVSLGGGDLAMVYPVQMLVAAMDSVPSPAGGSAERVGQYAAQAQGMAALNLRSAHRAVAGGEPGPEGAVAKLVMSELLHEAGELLASFAGPQVAFMDGDGGMANTLLLLRRGMAIGGGTSEIKRNQIGERLLGLPRDPLVS